MEQVITFCKLSGYSFAVVIFNYLGIPQEQLGILAVLMALDFVTGVMKQYRINPQKIESGRAWL